MVKEGKMQIFGVNDKLHFNVVNGQISSSIRKSELRVLNSAQTSLKEVSRTIPVFN